MLCNKGLFLLEENFGYPSFDLVIYRPIGWEKIRP